MGRARLFFCFVWKMAIGSPLVRDWWAVRSCRPSDRGSGGGSGKRSHRRPPSRAAGPSCWEGRPRQRRQCAPPAGKRLRRCSARWRSLRRTHLRSPTLPAPDDSTCIRPSCRLSCDDAKKQLVHSVTTTGCWPIVTSRFQTRISWKTGPARITFRGPFRQRGVPLASVGLKRDGSLRPCTFPRSFSRIWNREKEPERWVAGRKWESERESVIQLPSGVERVLVDSPVVLGPDEFERSVVTERTPFRVNDDLVGIVVVFVPQPHVLQPLHVAGVGPRAEDQADPARRVLPGAGHQSSRRVVKDGHHVDLNVTSTGDGFLKANNNPLVRYVDF